MHHGNGRPFLAVLFAFAALVSVSFSLPASAAGTAYYVNNLPGSNCSDSGSHSQQQPWCTFAPVNRVHTFLPGDQILLASGGVWNQQMTLAGSGTQAEPIILSSYGAGASPKILRNQAISDICILLTDGNHWNISNLEVGQASVGILLHYNQLSNEGIDLNNIDAHDLRGIWGGYSTDYPVRGKTPDPFAASLNINLSSGILFNISSTLTFSSSQYVLKGVSVSNIRGTRNVDSVAFDAETDSTDNTDGHSAFQDVTLNGLILSTDNGHAGKAYRDAGLGCSDSLRLLGMTNVRVMNSVLYEEAGCHTGTGTAAVILGRVSQVTFVNNILFGVPSTDSPDETGIDLEWSEDHVSLHANLFAGNAGAGVEILNIHPSDHSTDLDFRDNTFSNNARSVHPGAASVWEYFKGRGFATPSGTIQNNLYSEPNGRFFGGQNIRSMKAAQNQATASAPYHAAEQFAATQGTNRWRYMYEAPDSTWKNMPHFAAADYNGAWEVSAAQYISAFNMAPASSGAEHNGGSVARVWVAPHRGTVSIRGHILKADARGGAGIYAAINLVSGRNVTHIWPESNTRQLVAGTDFAGLATDADDISVATGDLIQFVVTANGENVYDTVSWTPSIGYVTPEGQNCPGSSTLRERVSSSQSTPSRTRRDCGN